MNLVVWCPKKEEYYLACVKRSAGGEGYVAFGKRISKDGKLLEMCKGFELPSEEEAEAKCRELAKTKRRKRGGKAMEVFELPKPAQRFLEVPADMQVTPEELALLAEEARREVYVVFEDVTGMEEWFDAGVQYVGSETADKDVLRVFDKFGERRSCFRSRARSIEITEQADKAF